MIYCTKCGREIDDHSKYCSYCGGLTIVMNSAAGPAAQAARKSAASTGFGQEEFHRMARIIEGLTSQLHLKEERLAGQDKALVYYRETEQSLKEQIIGLASKAADLEEDLKEKEQRERRLRKRFPVAAFILDALKL